MNGWGDARVDPRWTFPQAAAAAVRWHATINRELAERRLWSDRAGDFDAAVDYAPLWNEPFRIVGFDVVPLRSGRDLSVEGMAMHHCVGSYSRQVRSGSSRIFSLHREGHRVATVEIGGTASGVPALYQVRGPCNARCGADVVAAARKLAREAKRLLDEARKSRQAMAGKAFLRIDGREFELRGQMTVTPVWEG